MARIEYETTNKKNKQEINNLKDYTGELEESIKHFEAKEKDY